MKHRPWLTTVIKVVVVALCFGYVVVLLVRNLSDLEQLDLKFRWLPLLASLPLAGLYLVTRGLVWHLIVSQVIRPLPRGLNILSWLGSLLGKYVPGKVFLLLGRVYLYRRVGVSAGRVGFAFLMESACSTLATLAVFGVSLAFRPGLKWSAWGWAAAAVAGSLLLATHPALLALLARTLLRLFGRKPETIPLRWRDILGWTVLLALNWLTLGLGFWLLLRGVYDIPAALFVHTTGSLALAGAVGVMALFAPSGIGVRDSMLAFLLSSLMPPGLAAAAALLARVWITVAESICSGAALLLVRRPAYALKLQRLLADAPKDD